MNKFRLKNITLNENSTPFIVAEIGINFNGSMELAKKTIFAAKKSGADSVKFQYYKTEDFISNKKIDDLTHKLILFYQYTFILRKIFKYNSGSSNYSS